MFNTIKINPKSQTPFKGGEWVDWKSYTGIIEFIELYNFQQSVRRSNLRNEMAT